MLCGDTEADGTTNSHNASGHMAQDPHIKKPRRGVRKRIPNRKFTEDMLNRGMIGNRKWEFYEWKSDLFSL